MKGQVLLLLALLASATYAAIEIDCIGFSNGSDCFNTDADIIANQPFCKTMKNPDECSECYGDGVFKLNSGGNCYFDDETYKAVDLVNDEIDDSTTIDFINVFSKGVSYSNASNFDVTKLSCVKEGTIIPESCVSNYYYDETEYICKQCSDSNCVTCTSADAGACTKCANDKALVDGNCVDCGDNALTCKEQGKATTCSQGYFVNSSNECEKCVDDHGLCSSATNITACFDGYYKYVDEDTSEESCVACNTSNNNVYLCTGDPTTVANIVQCNKPDSGYYYYLTLAGCIEHSASYNCLTLTKDETNYVCGSCFTGYTKLADNICYENCDSDEYMDKETGSNYGDCESCISPCATCEQKTKTENDATVYYRQCNSWDETLCTIYNNGVYTKYTTEESGTFSGTVEDKTCVYTNPSGDQQYCKTYSSNNYDPVQYSCEECFDGKTKKIVKDSTSGDIKLEEQTCELPETGNSSSDIFYCAEYTEQGATQTCNKCFSELTVSGTTITVATMTDDDNKVSCFPVYEDALIYQKNCLILKKGINNQYECEVCKDGYTMQYTYTDTSADSFATHDYSKYAICISPITTAGTAGEDGYNCSIIHKNANGDIKCDLSTACLNNKQLLKITDNTVSTEFDGSVTKAYCQDPDTFGTGNNGNYCKEVLENVVVAGAQQLCVDHSTPAATCITKDRMVYSAAAATLFSTGSAVAANLLYCDDIDNTATSRAFNCDVVLTHSSAYSCEATTTCPDSMSLIKVYGADTVATITGSDFLYQCTTTSTLPTALAGCLSVEVSGTFYETATARGDFTDADEQQCALDTLCASGQQIVTTYSGQANYDGVSAGTATSRACVATPVSPWCLYVAHDSTGTPEFDDECDINITIANQKCLGDNEYLKATVGSVGDLTATAMECEVSGQTDDHLKYCKKYAFNSATYYCQPSADDDCKSGSVLAKRHDGSTDGFTGTVTDTCAPNADRTSLYCNLIKYSSDLTTKECDSTAECTSAKAMKVLYAGTTSGSFSGDETYTCVDIPSTSTNLSYQCLKFYVNSASTPDYQCVEIAAEKSCNTDYIFAIPYTANNLATEDSDNAYCMNATSLPTHDKHQCTTLTSTEDENTLEVTYTCSTCKVPHFYSSSKCLQVDIDHCEESASQTTCKTCDTYYWPSKESTSCVSCSDHNCASYKLDDAGACKCSECKKGYYLIDEVCGRTGTYEISHCLNLSNEMTKEADCIVCDLGYFWNSTTYTCDVCDSNSHCPKTGCSSVLNPSSSGSSSGSNSAIIAFVFSAFLAIVTLLF